MELSRRLVGIHNRSASNAEVYAFPMSGYRIL
jgi:hypothetical protein